MNKRKKQLAIGIVTAGVIYTVALLHLWVINERPSDTSIYGWLVLALLLSTVPVFIGALIILQIIDNG